MVQYDADNPYRGWDEFSIHPYIEKSGYFSAYDKGKFKFKSNRPEWKKNKETERPIYDLMEGDLKPAHRDAIIASVDEFIRKNFDSWCM